MFSMFLFTFILVNYSLYYINYCITFLFGLYFVFCETHTFRNRGERYIIRRFKI